MSGWLTTGEVAEWFGCDGVTVRRMLADPQHAEFAARVVKRGTQLRFPAQLTWFYACEAVMPKDRADLVDFLEHCPVPDLRRNEPRLVETRAS